MRQDKNFSALFIDFLKNDSSVYSPVLHNSCMLEVEELQGTCIPEDTTLRQMPLHSLREHCNLGTAAQSVESKSNHYQLGGKQKIRTDIKLMMHTHRLIKISGTSS